MSDTVVLIGEEPSWRSSAQSALAERGLQVFTAPEPAGCARSRAAPARRS